MERRNDIKGGEVGTPRAHDLTRIEGIGPKIASRLAASGVLTFADLAERPVDEIIKLLSDISLSRTKVEHWCARAREMADTQEGAAGTEQPTDSRPYESFLVRVLLDESGSIRSTTVQHVQSTERERWAAWDREALLDFVESRIGVTTPPEQEPRVRDEPAPELPVQSVEPEAADEVPESAGVPQPGGTAVRRTDIAPGLTLDLPDRQRLHADAGFDMTITLDLTAADLRAERLAYHAIVVARQLGAKTRYTVASADGLVPVSAPTIRLEGRGLPVGTYRLEAAVSLREPGAVHPEGLAATAEFLTLEIPAN
ncbi:helix-hairpin-helix domain-containing protein [Streptomyces sp. NBC_00459]|uniref:helix-hairpin-helix domain-containing protein n=1 Tax=Streptomyces sp. NBC_00459 TaxID=2975749 RepID=UPI002E17F52A